MLYNHFLRNKRKTNDGYCFNYDILLSTPVTGTSTAI